MTSKRFKSSLRLLTLIFLAFLTSVAIVEILNAPNEPEVRSTIENQHRGHAHPGRPRYDALLGGEAHQEEAECHAEFYLESVAVDRACPEYEGEVEGC
jgi:hypothetical protein